MCTRRRGRRLGADGRWRCDGSEAVTEAVRSRSSLTLPDAQGATSGGALSGGSPDN